MDYRFRYQLEIPVERVKKAGEEYTLASGTKKVKRYVTEETKEFLLRQQAGEACKEAALQDIQRKMFFQFSKHANILRKAIGCISLLDSLLSLAGYSSSLETSCFPEISEDASQSIDIKEGSHPCLDLKGEAFIPNDTLLGGDRTLIILTGNNTVQLVFVKRTRSFFSIKQNSFLLTIASVMNFSLT